MKTLRRLCFALVYALPAVLFFSYYPIISLGNDATMNFEFSLPLIWLILFDVVAFATLIALGLEQRSSKPKSKESNHRSKPGSNPSDSHSSSHANPSKSSFWSQDFGRLTDRKFFLFALFPLYATLSIFWSANPLRALLTAGIIWLLFFAAFALIYLMPLLRPAKHFPRRLVTVFFISTAVICLFCWVQCLLDVLGVPRDSTLLCLGCTSWTFGFPHPSGFAIEPQYMGNLLLAPTLLALYLLVFRKNSSQQRRYLFAFASFFSATLFLTLSRGAIYAYVVALIILFIFALVRHLQKSQFLLIAIPVLTFFITLIMQGVFATISPTADNFCSGTTKVIHQLSLGIIDLRPESISTSDDSSASGGGSSDSPSSPSAPGSSDSASNSSSASSESESSGSSSFSSFSSPSDSSVTPDDSPTSKFDGYIPASTNVRLGLSGVALQTWPRSPIFGVGLGGAGIAVSRAFPENSLAVPNAIIQNEPISLLLELGLVGIALVVLVFWLAFGPRSGFWQNPDLPLFLALIVAYLITLQFFSGPANALQIYLIPPLLYLVGSLAASHSA